nr:MAG: hypothetical protein J07AB56_07750 [Candidatus Nanosalinarum sp. J07AB56]
MVSEGSEQSLNALDSKDMYGQK